MSFNHGRFMRELRARFGPVSSELYGALIPSIEAALREQPQEELPLDGVKPQWVVEGMKHMGLKEVPGPKHNPTILKWIKDLGGWFTDDETPWCGTFMAMCMKAAGIEVPRHWYRAKEWAKWGKPCVPMFGAVAVFGRQGGGHVGMMMGASNTHFYILGGNQSNQVSITPISRKRFIAARWPDGVPAKFVALPGMSGGTVSENEA